MGVRPWLLGFLALAAWTCGCVGGEPGPTPNPSAATLTVSSPAFGQGKPIPSRHTCDGEDLSPALTWGEPPPRTRAIALICDDPDAPRGTWTHWVLCNLPPSSRGLPEGQVPEGSVLGRNDFGKQFYKGPCPPPGRPHRYFFRVYALDAPLSLEPGASRADVLRAIQGHVLAQGELMGTYQRQKR